MSTIPEAARAGWGVFAATAPAMSAQVRTIFERNGQAFGYLATLRQDGGPRVHPVSPVITSDGLFCVVLPPASTVHDHYVTARDLRHDGRYALHAGRRGDADDEACLAGWAVPVTASRQAAVARAGRRAPVDGQLFEFTIALAIVTRHHPADGRASQAVWRPP